MNLRLFQTNRHLSYLLLRTAVPPDAVSTFESLMRQMRLSTGVYRTTYRGRFHELDQVVNDLLATRWPSETALEVHDWAASDCLTSAEWAPSLFNMYPGARLTASDLTLCLVEVELPGGDAFIVEEGMHALQYILSPFVIWLNPPESKRLVVNRLLFHYANAKFARVRKNITIPIEWLNSSDDQLRLSACTLRKIPVIHPEAQALRIRDRRFLIERHSVFEALNYPVDVIRSMNIYNLVYFPRERLSEGIRAVWESLKPGGCWIVGRTHSESPPAHNVSVLEKHERGFEVRTRIGEGSEIEDLALNCEHAATIAKA